MRETCHSPFSSRRLAIRAIHVLILTISWGRSSGYTCRPQRYSNPFRHHYSRPSMISPGRKLKAITHPPRCKESTIATVLSASGFPFLPLIGAQDTWGNWAVIAGAAAAGQVLGNSTAVGRLLGPPVTAMTLTFFLASVGILTPGGTAAAKSLQLLSLQLATPLILLGADLRDAAKRCGPLLLSFMLASLSTLVASVVGWKVIGKMLTNALGRDGLVIAAALLAKNIGGGINYVAVCRSLDASPTAVAAGLCVDNIFALIYFPVTSALARHFPDVHTQRAVTQENTGEELPITVPAVTNLLCLSAALLWLGERIGGTSGALPVCTLLTVLLASRAPRERFLQPIQPAAECLGMVCLYLFFATAGAPGLAVADSVRASLLPLGIFLTLLYSIHGGILTLVHLFLGRFSSAFDAQRLLVASSAAIGGPATAVALAQTAGWKSLAVPSLLVGNIGFAIATFCALAFYSILR